MPSSAAAQAKARPLSRQEALYILNRIPTMIVTATGGFLDLLRHAKKFGDLPIVELPFEVFDGSRSYTFKARRFRILREVTCKEYLESLPPDMRKFTRLRSKVKYYEVHTD